MAGERTGSYLRELGITDPGILRPGVPASDRLFRYQEDK